MGVDGTASSLDAVRWGAGEAGRRQVRLRLVHAYWVPGHDFPELELTDEDVRAEMRRFGSDLLTRATRVAVETERALLVETELRAGDPRVVLLDECRHAGIAVLGSRQLSATGGLLVGSIGLTLAIQGRCPLVVVRGAPVDSGPVLVGSDGSPSAGVALGFAFTEADLTGATLTVVRTWDGIPTDAAARHEQERQALDEQLSPWRERFPGVLVDPVVVRGKPGAVLLEYGRHARLVVVGSRGHGEVTGLLLGSTSQRLVRRSPCPLAIVRWDMRVPNPLRESPGSRSR